MEEMTKNINSHKHVHIWLNDIIAHNQGVYDNIDGIKREADSSAGLGSYNPRMSSSRTFHVTGEAKGHSRLLWCCLKTVCAMIMRLMISDV